MAKAYDTPIVVDLGDFSEVTEYGIGGKVEGNYPLTDRPL